MDRRAPSAAASTAIGLHRRARGQSSFVGRSDFAHRTVVERKSKETIVKAFLEEQRPWRAGVLNGPIFEGGIQGASQILIRDQRTADMLKFLFEPIGPTP